MEDKIPRQLFTRLVVMGIVIAAASVACAPAPPEETTTASPMTIVFVHGARGGGWQFHKEQPLLEEAGHRVLCFAKTDPGLVRRPYRHKVLS